MYVQMLKKIVLEQKKLQNIFGKQLRVKKRKRPKWLVEKKLNRSVVWNKKEEEEKENSWCIPNGK